MSEATNLYAVNSVIRIIRNQRVKLTAKRFPRFVVQFTMQASAYRRSQIATGSGSLRSQFLTLKSYLVYNEQVIYSRSQFVTLNSQRSGNQDVASFTPENIGKNRHIPGADQ